MIRRILFYLGYITVWTSVITAAGACAGAVAFPLIGTLAGASLTAGEMALSGVRQLGFLTFIWALGIAVVLAFNHAWKQRHPGSGS